MPAFAIFDGELGFQFLTSSLVHQGWSPTLSSQPQILQES